MVIMIGIDAQLVRLERPCAILRFSFSGTQVVADNGELMAHGVIPLTPYA
jgi:hypothetical protein